MPGAQVPVTSASLKGMNLNLEISMPYHHAVESSGSIGPVLTLAATTNETT